MDVKNILIFNLFAIALNAQAEIYRWVDKDGKVHFTDRKPPAEAENITKDVKPQNLDTSNSELQKIVSMREQEAQRNQQQYEQEQQRQAARRAQLAELNRSACEETKKRLEDIRGHVIFTDDQGRAVTVRETERQQMVADLEQQIREHCSY